MILADVISQKEAVMLNWTMGRAMAGEGYWPGVPNCGIQPVISNFAP